LLLRSFQPKRMVGKVMVIVEVRLCKTVIDQKSPDFSFLLLEDSINEPTSHQQDWRIV
jgi:hypothetical protein